MATEAGYVYLIQAGDHWKIGKSKDPAARVKTIPSTLGKPVLVHAIRTDDQFWLERLLQSRFINRRAGGEWFKLTPDDVTLFCSASQINSHDSLPEWLHGTDLAAFTQKKLPDARHAAAGTTTLRLSEECRAMIREVADWHGITDTGVIEAAVRIWHQRGRPVATDAEVQAALAAIAPPPTEAPAPAPKRPRGRPRKKTS